MPCRDAGPKGLYPNLEWEIVRSYEFDPYNTGDKEVVIAAFMREEDANIAVVKIFAYSGNIRVRKCPC